MTHDEIIRMAREAGFADGVAEIVGLEGFARFAALVAAAEREACAKVCDRMWNTWLDSPEENEPYKPDAEDCAKAIRARGQG